MKNENVDNLSYISRLQYIKKRAWHVRISPCVNFCVLEV